MVADVCQSTEMVEREREREGASRHVCRLMSNTPDSIVSFVFSALILSTPYYTTGFINHLFDILIRFSHFVPVIVGLQPKYR